MQRNKWGLFNFYEDLVYFAIKAYLAGKSLHSWIQQLYSVVSSRETKREKVNKQTQLLRCLYIYWYMQKQTKMYSEHGKAFITFLNGIFIKSGTVWRMLTCDRCSVPVQWHIELISDLFSNYCLENSKAGNVLIKIIHQSSEYKRYPKAYPSLVAVAGVSRINSCIKPNRC